MPRTSTTVLSLRQTRRFVAAGAFAAGATGATVATATPAAAHPFNVGSHHGDQAFDSGGSQGIDYVAYERATVGFTQHFRQIRFHASTFSGGQNNSDRSVHSFLIRLSEVRKT